MVEGEAPFKRGQLVDYRAVAGGPVTCARVIVTGGPHQLKGDVFDAFDTYSISQAPWFVHADTLTRCSANDADLPHAWAAMLALEEVLTCHCSPASLSNRPGESWYGLQVSDEQMERWHATLERALRCSGVHEPGVKAERGRP